MTKVARLLRDEDHGVSSAHVIEAVRLAESLAAMRGRPLAGLTETARRRAGRDVRGLGRTARSRAGPARRRGRAGRGARRRARRAAPARSRTSAALAAAQTGGGGAGVGAGPAQGDRRWRAAACCTGCGCSAIDWAVPAGLPTAAPAPSARAGGCAGSRSCRCGSPRRECGARRSGAAAATRHGAVRRGGRPWPTSPRSPSAACWRSSRTRCPVVMRVLADRAALDADVGHLAQALPALVRSVRYGDVRGTDAEALTGSPKASPSGCAWACRRRAPGWTRTAPPRCGDHIDGVHQAVALLEQAAARVRRGCTRAGVPCSAGSPSRDRIPGLHPRPVRPTAAGRRPVDGGGGGAADGPGAVAGHAARRGGGVDRGLPRGRRHAAGARRAAARAGRRLAGRRAGDAFTDVLPLLRRTFAEYEPGVRRTVGELVRRGGLARCGGGRRAARGRRGGLPGIRRRRGASAPGWTPRVRDAVLPVLRRLLTGGGTCGRRRRAAA